MKELNEKLARWAGFENEGGRTWWAPGVEHHIVSQYYENYRYLPDFTKSLDACFEWLVPKLLEEYNIESYNFKQGDGWYYAETNIWRKGSTKHSFAILHDEHIAKQFKEGADLDKITALALCLAIEKLIGKEVLDE